MSSSLVHFLFHPLLHLHGRSLWAWRCRHINFCCLQDTCPLVAPMHASKHHLFYRFLISNPHSLIVDGLTIMFVPLRTHVFWFLPFSCFSFRCFFVSVSSCSYPVLPFSCCFPGLTNTKVVFCLILMRRSPQPVPHIFPLRRHSYLAWYHACHCSIH